MSILDAIKTQTNSLDDLAALPQAMIMQMAQKGQIRQDMLAPILGRKAEMADAVARTNALQSQGGQMPTVMEQLMQRNAEAEMPEARDMGVAQLPIREDMYSQGMAGGGIIAFEEGGEVDEEEKDIEDYENAQIQSMMLKSRVPAMEGYGIKAPQKEEAVGIRSDSMPLGMYATKLAEKYGIDPQLASYVMKKETGGSKDPASAVSSAGAQGVMQLMPGTAKEMGVKDSFDPYQNIEGGIKYLAMLDKKYNDPKLVAIAYNWGPGNTDKWLKSGADVSKLPAETRKYIAQLADGGSVQGYAPGGPVSVSQTLDPNEEIVDMSMMPTTPEDQFTFARYMQDLKGKRDAAKTDAEQDKYMALISAGLGMMSGTSANALSNIGAGGQKGLESYAASKKLRAAESANLDKSELGALRAKGIEDLRNQEIKNLAEYRKGTLEGKADKVSREAEDKEGRLLNKVDGVLNRDPVIRDFTKKMEMLTPGDDMYEYYLNEIEKIRSDAYKRAGIKTMGPRAKIGKPPAPKEEKGFWSGLFGSDKTASGSTMKFDEQGNPI